MATPEFEDPNVEAAFAAFPGEVRETPLALRALIFEISADYPETGRLEETLKWGQPSYLTPETKSGSTIRLGVAKSCGAAIYAHCQTTIISDFQTLFPGDFTYEGNRAVYLDGPYLPRTNSAC